MFMKLIINSLNYIQKIISKIKHIYDKKNPIVSARIALMKIIERNEHFIPISKDIIEYMIKNDVNVENFIKNFDNESKKTIKRVLDRVYYIYTHNILIMKKLMSLEEYVKKLEIDEYLFDLLKNIDMPVDDVDDVYDASIFYYDCGLKHLPKDVINSLKNKDFIDGGAFIGDSALMFEKFYLPKNIYAFEPENSNFNRMLMTIKWNNLKKVISINKGLGRKEEKLKIKSFGVISQISEHGEQEVSITTIDNFVFEKKLNIGLIKLDVEGFELNVLKGAEKTIKKFSPILLIAIYHNGKQFFETYNYIQKKYPKYKCIIRKIDPSKAFLETVLIAWSLI